MYKLIKKIPVGWRFSLILHLCFLLIISFNVIFFQVKDYQNKTIVVDILPVSKVTNLNRVNPTKTIKDNVIKEQKLQKNRKKENFSVKKQKLDKSLSDDLSNFFKDLSRDKRKVKKEKIKNMGKNYDQSIPLMVSHLDNIKSQIENNFTTPISLNFGPQEVVIRIRITMSIDQEVKDIKIMDNSKCPHKYLATCEALQNGLMRAVNISSPFSSLPTDLYHGVQGWNEIEISFDAHNLINR